MKIQLLCALLLATFVGCASPPPHADKKIKVLILTGGHHFKAGPFFKMFLDNPEITFIADQQVKAAEGYDRPDLYTFDVVVLYDAPTNITDAEKARFLALFDKGIGVVVLHHAYLAYPLWPEFGRIAGGRYIYWTQEITNGVTESIYKSQVRIPVTVVPAPHPITAGMTDFVLTNELYLNLDMAGNSTPLLKTGDEWVAWYRTEKRSRIVGTILGHDCYADPNFRKLVAQSIRWAAKR
jgi:type 1 glutamine amidotransferase